MAEKPESESVWSSRSTLTFTGKQDTVTKNNLSPRRWFILPLFVFCSMSNAFQWIQYSIIANVIQFYYNVDLLWVDWTSMVFMVAYVPLIFPGLWLLNSKSGLRRAIILGSCGTMIGAWIKCVSIRRNLFPVAFIGQTVSAVSQVFILGMPSRVAGVWFGSKEVSTACGIGVFGNQWIQFSIIANVMQFYYEIDVTWIDWTSMVYMIVYIILILPAIWFLNRKGLRWSMILGAGGTMTAAWIKCGSIQRTLFVVAFIGQTVASFGQVFTLGIPARLAAVWFGPSEVSTACAIGVFGNQLGVALGFLIPPEVVQMGNATINENETIASITRDFQILHYSNAGFCTLIFLLILLFFSDHPEIPPSAAALAALQHKEDYKRSLLNLITNKNYVILLISYGINVGAFYAISTLLNQVFLIYFPGGEKDAGRIGLTIVIAGMVGSVISGYWLDKTHKFKQTALAIYLFSCAGMVTYTFIFRVYNVGLVYFVAGVLGFFMTGYLPVGFEFASELTYPASEGMSSGLLNASSQIFGIIFTICCGMIMRKYDNDVYANLCLAGSLGLGVILTAFVKGELRRQKVQMNSTKENSRKNSTNNDSPVI